MREKTRLSLRATRPNTPIPKKKHRAADSYSNPMARIGFGQFNIAQMSDYPLTRLTQNFALLNSLYRTEWIARRIIDTLPQDMTKNWYELKSQLPPDQLDIFATMERKTRLKDQINEGLTWGRLFGGAAGIIVIEGQEDMLDQPLNLDLIMPGQYKGLIIADRWSGVYPESSIVQDISDPDFGTPEYYNFNMTDTDMVSGIRVHHSRVVRFLGRRLPQIERISESYWGMSELEHVYNELDKRNSASANIAHLLWQANLKIFKMRDLGQLLTTTDVLSQKELYETLTMQNALLNNAGMGVVDKDDDFLTSQYTFSGISEVYELFMLDVAGASEYPVTKLFGRSPAGMNSTGESDLTNYYDHVKQGQENDLRPIIEKLLPVLAMSTWGAIPDDLTFEFNPVRDSSESERADLMLKYTQAICAAYTNNIISQATALKELRQTSSFTGAYTNIDDKEIEQAAKYPIPDSLLEGFPSPPEPADSSVQIEDALDFPGQKREHGRFAEGKMAGGESNAPKTKPVPAEEFQSRLAKGEVNTKLRKNGGIDKHDPKSNEYQRHSRQRQKDGKAPASKFTVKNPSELRDEILSEKVQRTARTYEINGIVKQEIQLDRSIGIAYNKRREQIQTRWLTVEYSPKDGMHYYPIVPPVGKG